MCPQQSQAGDSVRGSHRKGRVSICNVPVDPELWSKGPEPHPGKGSPVPGIFHPLPGATGGCAELERSRNYQRGLDAVGVLQLKSSLIEREKLP